MQLCTQNGVRPTEGITFPVGMSSVGTALPRQSWIWYHVTILKNLIIYLLRVPVQEEPPTPVSRAADAAPAKKKMTAMAFMSGSRKHTSKARK